MTKIGVVLADDQRLVRTGFRMILEHTPDINVLGEASDGEETIRICHELNPDVVLMDIRMPVLDGIEATRLLRHNTDDPPKVLILTTFDLDEYVLDGLRAGASGFLLKDTLADDLVAAIRAVASGDAVVSPSATRRLLERFIPGEPEHQRPPPRDLDSLLTSREREVLGLIARGFSNSEIAARLYITEGTVKTHVGHLLAKLDLRDRVQAVILAYEAGLVRAGQKQ